MDLGATICAEASGLRDLSVGEACAARARGDQESFPRKATKKGGELRRGAAFVALRADGHILLRTRTGERAARRNDRGTTTEWAQRLR